MEGLILVWAASTLDGNPVNNFLKREVTFNPDGVLTGAKHAVGIGSRIVEQIGQPDDRRTQRGRRAQCGGIGGGAAKKQRQNGERQSDHGITAGWSVWTACRRWW